MEKRGQVTLFVILGLIVLILVSVVIFMSQKKVDQPPIERIFQAQYNEKMQPLANDISFCINTLGQKAFEEIGAKGGYINPGQLKYGLKPEYMNDGVELFPGSGVVLPYWYSIDGAPRCENCVANFDVPPLVGSSPKSVQSQVQTYVEENIVSCMNDFEDYKNEMDIKYGVPKATVIFRDESTFIGLNWSVDAIFPDGNNASMSTYSSVIDLEFKKVYDLALDVLGQMELYDTDKKLERFTSDVITMMGLGGRDALIPPVEGPSISTLEAPRIWNLRETKDYLKQGLSGNLNYVQIIGSRDSFVSTTNDSYFNSIYSSFQNYIYTDNDFLSKTRVRFDYEPIWPMYLGVTPGFGEIAMPHSDYVNLLFFQMGMTRYQFSYDVTYPVVVSLEEPTAFDGKGYTFQYAYEVNIRNNKAYSNDTIFLNQSQFYTEDGSDEVSGFGAIDQRTIPVKIKVYDGYNLDPMPDFSVVYTCMGNTIVVGKSEMKDGQAVIDTKLPPCVGGQFSTLDIRYGFDPVGSELLLGQNYDFDFMVYPDKNVTIKPSKRLYVPGLSFELASMADDPGFDRAWHLASTSPDAFYTPMEDEQLYLVFTKIINGAPSDSYVRFKEVAYPNTSTEMELTPGYYKVDLVSTVMLGENYSRPNIYIPERTYEDVGSTLFTSGEDVTLPEVEINDSFYLGGLTLDNTTLNYVHITPENIASDQELFIYYPAMDIDNLKFVQDFEGLNKVQSAGEDHKALFTPKFEDK